MELPCKLWKGPEVPNKHGHIRIYRQGKRTYAHRYVWKRHNGSIPKGMMVCHHCDNPSCVEISHLFLGTHQDNMNDMTKKGRRIGVTAILTDAEVTEIRDRFAVDGAKILAEEFDVHKRYIYKLVNGERR